MCCFSACHGSLDAHAGAAIKEAFYKEKNVEHKGVLPNVPCSPYVSGSSCPALCLCCLPGAVDLVTETDKHCEAVILSKIQSAFPDHKFIGEEGSAAQVGPMMLQLS